MTLRIWLFIGFAFFVVACIMSIALVAMTAGDNNNAKAEKIAIAVITGLLSLISGGIGSVVTGSTVQESTKESAKEAAKAVAKGSTTRAANEAAKSAAENVSGQVSTAVTKAIERKAAAKK